jgi:cytochrome c biogenesis protein ResB
MNGTDIADTILTILFFGLVIGALLERIASGDSEEVEQFHGFVTDWIRRLKG